jgi:truncated hemoglobin YjbI
LPTLHREAGFAFRFRAGDRGERPHVHVYGNAGHAKIWLAPEIEVDRIERYDVAQEHAIVRITREHRDEWLAAWNEFFSDR